MYTSNCHYDTNEQHISAVPGVGVRSINAATTSARATVSVDECPVSEKVRCGVSPRWREGLK